MSHYWSWQLQIVLVIIFTSDFLQLVRGGPKEYVYDSSYAYVKVRKVGHSNTEKTFCVHYQQWKTEPIKATPDGAPSPILHWWDNMANNFDVCESVDPSDLAGFVVPVEYHANLSLATDYCHSDANFREQWADQIDQIQTRNASAIFYQMQKGKRFFTESRDYLFAEWRNPWMNNSEIPIFYSYYQELKEMLKLSDKEGSDLSFSFYRPATLFLDPALVIMFSLAVFSVALGGWWSGRRRRDLWRDEVARERERRSIKRTLVRRPVSAATTTTTTSAPVVEGGGEPRRPSTSRSQEDQEPSATPCTWFTLAVMVASVVAMLLLAYFFRSVIIWFIIVLFTLGSALALYNCSAALCDLPCGRCRVCLSLNDLTKSVLRRELCQWEWCHARPMWRNVLLLTASCSIAVLWCIYRNWPYAFILQDLLSVAFCVHFLKCLRFPNLKWLTVLLIVMLVYDLVMVFITPYLTKNGCSIMVQVATGQTACAPPNPNNYPIAPTDANSTEIIPILLRVPRLSDPMLPCYDLDVELQFRPFMLGLGDIILPGFLIGYCWAVDFLWKVPYHIYGVSVTISYGLGLIVTFVALYLMEQAQPALIYLIPFTLLTVIAVGAARHELGLLWRGDTPTDDHLEQMPIIEEGNSSPYHAAQNDTTGQDTDSKTATDSNNA